MELVLPERAVGLVDRFLAAIDSGTRADRLLAKLLKDSPELPSAERALVAAWCLGVCVWRGRLDAMARGDRSLWFALFLIDREDHPATDVAEALRIDCERLVDALATPAPENAVGQLAFRRSLPSWLAARWIDQFGPDRADALAAAMNERGPIAIRSYVPREELQRSLAAEGVTSRPSRLTQHGLLLEGRPNIVGLEAWRLGQFEVQDEGSQLIAEAVQAKPGQRILELCAGSGGKTLALAGALRNEGQIHSIDNDAQRLIDLEVRLKRHRRTCVQFAQLDATNPRAIPFAAGTADAVLIDAPCSSLGTLRRSPDGRWRLTPRDVERWSVVQRQLLQTGQLFVKPGGRLVYATCSTDRAENEEVAATLTDHQFERVEERRTSPDTDGCDGFYWCVWRRRT